ncbi:hypothetical protein [Streptomyces sp. NPDC005435]|uniref:hypothetical protein n=1 Tax=Streptomyces sp. NPDC005435 TaxID=3154464 RepID=UPI0034548077
MDLRPELSPPPVSRQRLAELCDDIERIAGLLLRGDESAEDEIRGFNAKTGHAYVALDFTAYEGSRSLREFASEAGRPARPRIADIVTDELVEVVRRILAGSPETGYYLRLLQANVPHPRVGDLIFHPPAGLRGASPEQLVDEALGYRPIAL